MQTRGSGIRSHRESGQSTLYLVMGLAFVAVIVALFFFFSSWRNVDPGNVGVKINRTNGEITIIRTIGWLSIDPTRETFVEYPAIDQTIELIGDNRVRGRSSEGQALGIDNALQFRLTSDDEALKRLIRSFGGAGMDTIIQRVVVPTQREAVSANSALYGWEDAFSAKRAELTAEIQSDIASQLKDRGIEVIDFNIRDIDLPDQLDAFINEKIQAQQRVDQARYELEQAEVNSQQLVVEAQAEADSVRIRAQAEADANRLINSSLSPTLVQYLTAQKWDGKLPQVSGEATPLIQLPATTP